MTITTETALGNIIFKTVDEAVQFAVEMAAVADDGETYEVQAYQGNRFHVARFYNGAFEAYC
jgi:hypothetical protein